MTIGDKIRTLRKYKGFNQTELGERLGVKTNAVSKWECGRVEDIPMSKVKMMANLFEVPVSYLIDDDTQDEKEQPTVSDGLSFDDLTEMQRFVIAEIIKMPEDRLAALAKFLGLE